MANETNVPIQRVKAPEVTRLPIFDEIGKRMQEIERRAFELFQQRGGDSGKDLDDWLLAEREVNGLATTNLEETDDAYNLQVSLPEQMEPSEVEVTATPHSVILHAEHREEKKSKKSKAKEGEWSQVSQTCVYREVPLAGIDPDQVTARLEKGTLRVTAHKAPSAEHQRRVIAVA